MRPFAAPVALVVNTDVLVELNSELVVFAAVEVVMELEAVVDGELFVDADAPLLEELPVEAVGLTTVVLPDPLVVAVAVAPAAVPIMTSAP